MSLAKVALGNQNPLISSTVVCIFQDSKAIRKMSQKKYDDSGPHALKPPWGVHSHQKTLGMLVGIFELMF